MKRCLLVFLLATPAAFSHPVPPIAGTFSNLTYIEGEGDVTGMEVSIIPAGSAGEYTYSAIVQTADGVPATPQIASVKVDGKTIVFAFEYPGAGAVTFTGKISKKALVGGLAGEKMPATAYTLPRKIGFWQPAP